LAADHATAGGMRFTFWPSATLCPNLRVMTTQRRSSSIRARILAAAAKLAVGALVACSSGNGGSGAGGGGTNSGSTKAVCNYTLSGARTGSGMCNLSIQLVSGKLDMTFLAATADGPELSATLPGPTLMATTYTSAQSTTTVGTLVVSVNQEWGVCWNTCYSSGNTIPNYGDFTLKITSAGVEATEVGIWGYASGTLTATFAAEPESSTTGTVTVNATFN